METLARSVSPTVLEMDMRTIVIASCLVCVASLCAAAPAPDRSTQCQQMVGKETGEGEGRAHMGRMQSQRLSDCMMGMPNATPR